MCPHTFGTSKCTHEHEQVKHLTSFASFFALFTFPLAFHHVYNNASVGKGT